MATLTEAELGDALLGGAVGECSSERAAIGLLVAHDRCLARPELRRAIETSTSPDGDLVAWVIWERVHLTDGNSSDEERLLALACSLGGAPNDRPLSELLCELDDTNATRVLNAMWVACTGHPLTRVKGLWW